MKFTKEDLLYLKGSSFTSGYNLQLQDNATPKKIINRLDLLENILENRKVLHLGCADHIDLIEKKITNNTWLHKRITEKSSFCMGIDIDKEAIDYCIKLGFTNIINCDIYKDKYPEKLTDIKFDYILIGELLEHVDNPVSFLKQISSFFKGNFSKVIITGPNALRYNNFKLSLKFKESINSDHRFWFSPYTLAKQLSQAGYIPSEFSFCMTGGINKRNYFLKWLFSMYTSFQDTIVITAKVPE